LVAAAGVSPACGSSDKTVKDKPLRQEDGGGEGGQVGTSTPAGDGGAEPGAAGVGGQATHEVPNAVGGAGGDAPEAVAGQGGELPNGDAGAAGQGNVQTLLPCEATLGACLFAGDFISGGGGNAVDGTRLEARFDYPEGMVADAQGNIYVAQSNGSRVAKITPEGVVRTVMLHASAGALALGPDGSLYSAQVGSNCQNKRALPPLQLDSTTEDWNCTGATGGNPRGIAVSASGVVHIAYLDGNCVMRAGAKTNDLYPLSVFVGAANPYVPPGSTDESGGLARFNKPRGIAFGPNGDLFVADSGNHTIRRVTPAGAVSTFAGKAGENATQDGRGGVARFDNPTDLAFDADGNLYVLERGPEVTPLAHVRRINPEGDVETLFDATADIAAIGDDTQDGFSKNIRGMAVVSSRRIALAAGNGIVIRTLP